MYSEEDINHEESPSLDTLKQKFDQVTNVTTYDFSRFVALKTVIVDLAKQLYWQQMHCLWMYCDLSKNTIYLLMDSVNNSEMLLQLSQEVQPNIENEIPLPYGTSLMGGYGGSSRTGAAQDPPFAFISNMKPHENEKMDIESLLRRRKLDLRNTEHFEIKLLKDFAFGWLKWAATGYPRSFAKRGMAPSELPNAKQWIAGCIALQELLFGKLGKEILERKSFSAVDDTLNRRLKDCVQVGSGSTYRSNSGLDKWEGFVTNANFLLPLEIPLIANLSKKVQEELIKVKETHGWIIDAVGNDTNKAKKSRVKEDKLANQVTRKGFKQKGKNGDDIKNDSGSTWPILGNENNQQWTIPSAFYLNDFIQLIRDVQKNPIQLDETQSVISNVEGLKTGDINKEKRHRRGGKNNQKKESEKTTPPFISITPMAKDISKSEHALLKGYLGVEYECPLGHRFM
ncbi:12860_t:CDS:2, partial [Racocetra fulgida]